MALAAAYFLAFVANGLNVPLATPALLQAGFAASLIGGLASMRGVLQMVATPLWAAIADAQGSARMMAIRGQLSLIVAMIALAYADGPALLVVGYFIFGFFGGGSTTLIDALNLSQHREKFGTIRLFGTLGYAITILVTGQFAALSKRDVFAAAAIFSVLAAASLTAVPKPQQKPSPVKLLENAKRLLKQPTFVALIFIAALTWASHSAFTVFMYPLGAARAVANDTIAYTIVLGLGIEIVAMRFSGRVYAKIGPRNALIITGVVGLIRWAGLALTSGTASFVALHALHGISFGLFYPIVVTAAGTVAHAELRVTAQALLTSVGFGLGGAMGAALAGVAFDQWGAAATWASMLLPASAATLLIVASRGIRDACVQKSA